VQDEATDRALSDPCGSCRRRRFDHRLPSHHPPSPSSRITSGRNHGWLKIMSPFLKLSVRLRKARGENMFPEFPDSGRKANHAGTYVQRQKRSWRWSRLALARPRRFNGRMNEPCSCASIPGQRHIRLPAAPPSVPLRIIAAIGYCGRGFLVRGASSSRNKGLTPDATMQALRIAV
jgi:hypothetical protein